jgi:glyoxylate/hydroxypyruvate reductase A
MSILFRSDAARTQAWKLYFATHAPDIDFRTWPDDTGDLADVEYLVSWQAGADFLASMPNLKVLFASGAGIDHIDFNAVPPQVTVVRMVEPGIVNGMIEYVTMSVLALHRNLFDYVDQRIRAKWQPIPVRPASARTVGVMGLGVLGQSVLQRLAPFGFRLAGWNRSPKDLPGVQCLAGAEALPAFLAQCDVLVCLLPLTDATRGVLSAALLAQLPPGAALINVARGAHLDQQALLDALESGRLSRAILDVAEPEPLPADHPLWAHPRVMITPHIASMTQPETAAPVLLANLRRHLAGAPLHDVVDRQRGY